MFVQVYVVQLSSELGEARGCWGGEGGGAGTCLSKLGGGRSKLVHACLTSLAKLVGGQASLSKLVRQACLCLSDKLIYACLTSLFMLV